jgi:hypothetical protein
MEIGEGAFIAEPLRYLALIEAKPNALAEAAAQQNCELAKIFQRLRHQLEIRIASSRP